MNGLDNDIETLEKLNESYNELTYSKKWCFKKIFIIIAIYIVGLIIFELINNTNGNLIEAIISALIILLLTKIMFTIIIKNIRKRIEISKELKIIETEINNINERYNKKGNDYE